MERKVEKNNMMRFPWKENVFMISLQSKELLDGKDVGFISCTFMYESFDMVYRIEDRWR